MTVLNDTAVEPFGGCHHVGSNAENYRYAFKRGAKDALRLTARRIATRDTPLSTIDLMLLLERLSDEYEDDPDVLALSAT